MGRDLNLTLAIISILAMYSISNQNSKVGAEEVEEVSAYDRLWIMMENEECAAKIWPIVYKTILTTNAEKKNPEKRKQILVSLMERTMPHLDGIADTGCVSSSFDALLLTCIHIEQDVDKTVAYNLYSIAEMSLASHEQHPPPKQLAELFYGLGSMERENANKIPLPPPSDGSNFDPAPEDTVTAVRIETLRAKSLDHLRKALELHPTHIPYRVALAQCTFDADLKNESHALYQDLFKDRDQIDANTLLTLYQQLRLFALHEDKNVTEAEKLTEEMRRLFPWHHEVLAKAFLELGCAFLNADTFKQDYASIEHAEKHLRAALDMDIASRRRGELSKQASGQPTDPQKWDGSTLTTICDTLKNVLLKKAYLDGALTRYPPPQSRNTTAAPDPDRGTGGWETGGRDNDTPQVGHIDYLDPATFTNMNDFYESFLAWNRPVIIGKGLMESWPAMKEWTKEKLMAPGPRGDVEVVCGATPYPEKMGFEAIKTDVKDYIAQNLKDGGPRGLSDGEHPAYIFQEMETAAEKAAGYAKVGATQAEVSKLIASQRTHDGLVQNWTTILNDFKIPAHFVLPESVPWHSSRKNLPPGKHFYVGPRGSGTHPHNHPNAFNALVYGRKRWIIIPPIFDTDTAEIQAILGLADKNNNAIQGYLKNVVPKLAALNVEYIDVIQEPGEFFFVPNKWMHAIYNLEDSVGVAYQIGMPSTDWSSKLLKQKYPTDFIPKL